MLARPGESLAGNTSKAFAIGMYLLRYVDVFYFNYHENDNNIFYCAACMHSCERLTAVV